MNQNNPTMSIYDYYALRAGHFYAGCIGALFFVTALLAVFKFAFNISDQLLFTLGLFVPITILLLVVLTFVSAMHLRPIMGFTFLDGKSYLYVFLLIIFTYPIELLIAILTSYMTSSGNSSIVAGSEEYILNLGIFPFILGVAIIPAITEELIFRGVIFCVFRKRSFKCALIISAVSFAFYHMNIQQFGYALFFGCVFALVREITGSVFSTIIMHLVYNSISAVVSYYGIKYPETMQTTNTVNSVSEFFSTYWILLIIVAVSIACSIFLFYRFAKYKEWKYSEKADIRCPAITLWFVITWVICILISLVAI